MTADFPELDVPRSNPVARSTSTVIPSGSPRWETVSTRYHKTP